MEDYNNNNNDNNNNEDNGINYDDINVNVNNAGVKKISDEDMKVIAQNLQAFNNLQKRFSCLIPIAVVIFIFFSIAGTFLFSEYAFRIDCSKSDNVCNVYSSTLIGGEKLKKTFNLSEINGAYTQRVTKTTGSRRRHHSSSRRTSTSYKCNLTYGNNKKVYLGSFKSSSECDNIYRKIRNNINKMPQEGFVTVYD